MLRVQLHKLHILVPSQNLANMPPAAEGGEEWAWNVCERGEIATPHADAEGSDQQLHGDCRPGEEEGLHCNATMRKKGEGRGVGDPPARGRIQIYICMPALRWNPLCWVPGVCLVGGKRARGKGIL